MSAISQPKKKAGKIRKLRLLSELGILYLGIPVFFMLNIINLPLLPFLFAIGILIYIFLKKDPTFDRKTFFNWKSGRKDHRNIFQLYIAAMILMVAIIYIVDSSKLFILVRERLWLVPIISVGYPLFSVIPQGLAYRSLFFHRYGELFPNENARIIAASALFAFGHIIYKDPLVLALTFLAGLIFTIRYRRTNSLAITIFEHSLYGIWLFISGLGWYFVAGFVE